MTEAKMLLTHTVQLRKQMQSHYIVSWILIYKLIVVVSTQES